MFGGAEEASARAAFESRDAGFAGYVAENIAQFTTLEGLPLAGGFGLNVTNPLSAKEYAALGARMLTLSPELTLEDMARISAPVPVLALAYGHMPLMLTRACPLQNVRDCGAVTERAAAGPEGHAFSGAVQRPCGRAHRVQSHPDLYGGPSKGAARGAAAAVFHHRNGGARAGGAGAGAGGPAF